MKKQPLFALLLAGLLYVGGTEAASAQAMASPAATASTGKDLAASAALSPNHSTLLTALGAAGLADQAKGAGPYTVFAPDNAAFDKLPAGTVTTLLEPANKKKLANLLSYHVVAGNVMAADLKDGQVVKTVQGESLTVGVKGGTVTLTDAKGGKATVTKADIKTTNGVVHSIDTVLMPAK
ncbi:fasciclin domain-containing protein [Hymenobacter terrestris]|uniref:Fasciclin domain-containing protein n=1 Tax=Hymenobacter terrestris TaxID=2748310 RepID=A0ABX2Q099_9BACT|nr:fasciclin domain-containing protein [Hymenobacter terrestris]NVO83476.1 fasciclin domain-containing protein [Hymenobacter terrestris]